MARGANGATENRRRSQLRDCLTGGAVNRGSTLGRSDWAESGLAAVPSSQRQMSDARTGLGKVIPQLQRSPLHRIDPLSGAGNGLCSPARRRHPHGEQNSCPAIGNWAKIVLAAFNRSHPRGPKIECLGGKFVSIRPGYLALLAR